MYTNANINDPKSNIKPEVNTIVQKKLGKTKLQLTSAIDISFLIK